MNRFLIAMLVAATTAHAQIQENSDAPLIKPPKRDNRPLLDAYVIAPKGFNGGGFGMGGFSPALSLPMLSTNAELRLGGDFYFTGLDRRKFANVPLLAPQSGDAKVKLNETMFGINFVARLTMPWDEKVSPYIDGFAGLRAITTGMDVTPNQPQIGYENTTSNNIDGSYRLHYGVAGGLLIALGKDVKLNMGVVYSHSDHPGSVSNIRTASLENGSVVMDQKLLAQNMILFKLGVTVRIDPSKSRGHDCNCNCTYGGGVFRTGTSARSAMPNRVGTGVRVAK